MENNISALRLLIREMVNELTPNMASKVLDKRYTDKRAERIHPEAVKMVFRDYIGKSFPTFMKVRNENQPHKYQLIDVRWRTRMQDLNSNHVIKFDFHTDGLENNTGSDAPYADYKQQFTLTYDINNDSILNDENSDAKAYFYNRAFINMIIKLLNTARAIFNKEINSLPKYYAKVKLSLANNQIINQGDEVPADFAKNLPPNVLDYKSEASPVTPSHYKVGDFKIFDYSSNDIQY